MVRLRFPLQCQESHPAGCVRAHPGRDRERLEREDVTVRTGDVMAGWF